jgi:hypothetical protein
MDLVSLANRLVQLDREAVEVRSQMLTLLTNGAGHAPEGPSRPPVRTGGKSREAAMAAAKEAEQAIVELIKAQPLRTAEIARATGAKVNSTTERLKRLAAKNLVQRDDSGAWAATGTG